LPLRRIFRALGYISRAPQRMTSSGSGPEPSPSSSITAPVSPAISSVRLSRRSAAPGRCRPALPSPSRSHWARAGERLTRFMCFFMDNPSLSQQFAVLFYIPALGEGDYQQVEHHSCRQEAEVLRRQGG